MAWFKKKRTPLEVMANHPVRGTVGPNQKPDEQVVLELREPTMFELLGFIEGAVGDLVPVYSKSWAKKQINKVAKGKLDAGDFRLFQPAYVPICGFIAQCADRDDLKDELHKKFTPAQFVKCVNLLMYLSDVEELAVNFMQALARVTDATKAMKAAS